MTNTVTNNTMTNNTVTHDTMTNTVTNNTMTNTTTMADTDTMTDNSMSNNSMTHSNSRDSGITMIVDMLDTAVGKVDAVVSLPSSSSIIRLLLVEPCSGHIISHSVLVVVGGDLP